MIKVLRVITRMNIGGPAIHVSLLNEAMFGPEPYHFDSLLVIGSLSPDEGSMEYMLEWGGYIRVSNMQREVDLWKDLKSLYAIYTLIRLDIPDIVHTHTAKAGMLARTAAIAYNMFHKKKIKIVHTYHGNVFSGYFGWAKTFVFLIIERMLAKRTDVIIAVSPSQKHELERFKIKTRIEVIRLGFNLEPFLNCSTRKGEFRKEYNLGNANIVGIVGRLTAIKNHRKFLDIAKQMLVDDQSLKFVIIGDGELREELETYACELGIEKQVVFTGWVRDMQMIYADMSLLLCTSDNEGTPVAIIEAMASGVPVLSTDVGGVQDLLPKQRPGEYGLIRKTFSVGRAKRFVADNYSKERLIVDIEKLYEGLIK